MPPSPIIPPEVVEYIIDFFDSVDDKHTLLSCSLVSRSWVQSSQNHLFRSIRLSYLPFWQLNHRLHKVLTESPHLAHYIRDLQIVNDGFLFSPESWVNTEPSLPQLLPKLLALRSLTLWHMNWEVLLEKLQESLRALLARPSLTSFNLSRCRFPTFLRLAVLLSTARSLKRLSLVGTSTNDDDMVLNPDDQAPAEPVTLDYLALKSGVHFMPGSLTSPLLSHFLDITRLRTLVCSDDICCVSVVPLLPVLAQAGTLERLELGGIPHSYFDLRLMPSLRHLYINYIMMSVGQEFLAARLVGFVSNIRALTQLEDVHIQIEAHTTWPECIDWNVWAELDDLLTASELNHLRLITMDVCMYWNESLVACAPNTPAVTNELGRLKAVLPKLIHSGILQVNPIPALTDY
ncbi:hypothetical protein B0H13DRAFT_2031116 [Mycena leptocephala]|nr:hypothetical protein B0H13DRAFT_2031116 [Mycena leptocephala]